MKRVFVFTILTMLLCAGCRSTMHDANDHEYWGDIPIQFIEGDILFEGWILR